MNQNKRPRVDGPADCGCCHQLLSEILHRWWFVWNENGGHSKVFCNAVISQTLTRRYFTTQEMIEYLTSTSVSLYNVFLMLNGTIIYPVITMRWLTRSNVWDHKLIRLIFQYIGCFLQAPPAGHKKECISNMPTSVYKLLHEAGSSECRRLWRTNVTNDDSRVHCEWTIENGSWMGAY